MRNFDYLRPGAVDGAAAALADAPRTLALAGGTDLLDLMKSGVAAPERVVDLKALDAPGLRAVEERDGVLRVGALVTLREVAASDLLRRRVPALQQAAAAAASPQLRNVGTLGGNLCQRPRCWYFRDVESHCLRKGGATCFAVEGRNRFHAVVGGGPCHIVHPSDTAVALLALGARVTLAGRDGPRTLDLGAFHVLPEDDFERETVLRPGEVVTGVEIPAPPRDARSSYTKFRFRASWDFAVVSVALAVRDGRGGGARVALGGVAPVPWLDAEASAAAGGATPAGLERLAAAVLTGAQPMAENAYKVPLARNLTRRAAAALLA